MKPNKFNKFAGNKDCPKCHGEGSYMYDDMHGQICELCCTHPQGFKELDPKYWPESVGKEFCVFGCGAERKVKQKPKELDWKKTIFNKITEELVKFCRKGDNTFIDPTKYSGKRRDKFVFALTQYIQSLLTQQRKT